MNKREAIRGLLGSQVLGRFQDVRQKMPQNVTFEGGLFKGANEEMVAEENEADVEKEIPMEIKQGSLSVSQALEKAKSLTDGSILSQESYNDILNQVDEKERYPFTVALVEHEIRVASYKYAQDMIGTEQEYMEALDIIRMGGRPTQPSDWESSLAYWGRTLGRSGQQVYRELLDVGLKEKDAFMAVRDGFEGTGLTMARDVGRMMSGAVNVVDEIDGPEGGELWYPSKFPAGEIPSGESGTSELDFPHTRKVEGKQAQQIPEDFWDAANPQEANTMMGFVESNQYEDAWQLLKEVNSRVPDKNAEIGNSLIDLTTDKWAEQFSLNDLPRQVKTRYTEPVREPNNTKEYGSGHGPDSEAFEDKTMVSFAMKDMIEEE